MPGIERIGQAGLDGDHVAPVAAAPLRPITGRQKRAREGKEEEEQRAPPPTHCRCERVFHAGSSNASKAMPACVYAAPALSAMATSTASLISASVAPAFLADLTWCSMQYGHLVACPTAIAINSLVFTGST